MAAGVVLCASLHAALCGQGGRQAGRAAVHQSGWALHFEGHQYLLLG